MSVNYNLPTLNNRLQQVANAIDGGATNGIMVLLDGSNNILSTLPLSRPCGIVSADQLNFGGLALIDPSAAASGTALQAQCKDSNGTVVISGLTIGTVGSTSDIIFSPTNVIAAGQTVAITAASITGN